MKNDEEKKGMFTPFHKLISDRVVDGLKKNFSGTIHIPRSFKFQPIAFDLSRRLKSFHEPSLWIRPDSTRHLFADVEDDEKLEMISFCGLDYLEDLHGHNELLGYNLIIFDMRMVSELELAMSEDCLEIENIDSYYRLYILDPMISYRVYDEESYEFSHPFNSLNQYGLLFKTDEAELEMLGLQRRVVSSQ